MSDHILIIYALAAIGGVAVLVTAAIAGYLALGVFLIFTERGIKRAAKCVFFAFDGEANPSGEGRMPRPPWDRVWLEIRYGASIIKWVQTKLGYATYRNPLERPNVERLYELRRQDWG